MAKSRDRDARTRGDSGELGQNRVGALGKHWTMLDLNFLPMALLSNGNRESDQAAK
jgi:hypothetical protein